VPYSGWPFSKSHLEEYYERAQRICGLGPYNYETEHWAQLSGYPPLPFDTERIVTRIFHMRFPPLRFGEVYREDLAKAGNVSVYLNANALEFETNHSAQTVTRLRAACLQGPRVSISSRFYILAVGGIENARLLLLSNKTQTGGLGNQYDLVGRFFMEHPHLDSGLFLPAGSRRVAVDLYRRRSVAGAQIIGVLAPAESALRREQLLNITIKLNPIEPPSKGMVSAKRLVQGIEQREVPDDIGHHLLNILSDPDDVFDEVYKRLFNTRTGLFNNPHPLKQAALRTKMEQAPNPESRVTLSTDRDLLGQNKIRLNWQLSEIEQRSVRRSHELIAMEFGRAGLGRVRIDLSEDGSWPSSLSGGLHHMGTTRMHENPKQGVVDANCRVHGISNLFIAGSSVFPTSGSANPTLTIVALAIRLADQIKRLIR